MFRLTLNKWQGPLYYITSSSCIRCDRVRDCTGGLHEDEDQECEEEAIQASCLDWLKMGYTDSGQYLINPDGRGTLCVFIHF